MTTLASRIRDARLECRLNRAHKRLLEQAAALAGQPVSDFTIAHALTAAREVIERETVTRLSSRDRDLFVNLIHMDAKPNKALKAAARRYKGRRG